MKLNPASHPMPQLTLTFIIIFAALCSVQPSTAAEKPNIIVILADDLGFGDLSSYGAKDMRTPHVDRLLNEGMKFSNAYANCPVCSPTRAALLTGQYPDMVGVPGVIRTHAENNWGYFLPQAVTLPQLLRGAGYRTAIVGKWHLGLESPNMPNQRGFDYFHGFLGDMMDDYYTHRRHDNNYMREDSKTIEPTGHATDLFSDWAIQWINTEAKTPAPFFLYLAYNAPHTPIQPPADWLEKVRKREPNITEKRAKLVALIEHLDDGIGRVLAAVEQAGIEKNTLIVFASDNGGQLSVGANNGPWRGGKEDMYEGGLRIPFGVRWPSKIAPRSESPQPVLSMDLLPTLCAAAEVPVTHKIDGLNFLPTLLGTTQTLSPRDTLWVRREGGRYHGQDYYALRRGPWKLLHNSPFSPLELYRLDDDPQETDELSKKHPQQFQELEKALRAHLQRAGRIPWQKPD